MTGVPLSNTTRALVADNKYSYNLVDMLNGK